MATQDPTTQKSFDALADLVDAYDALTLLALAEDGHSAPVPMLLANLNRQLRAFVDQADSQRLVS